MDSLIRPCIYEGRNDHPCPPRKLSRYRRQFEAGLRIARRFRESVHYLVLIVRYDRDSGRLAVPLKESANRFTQLLRRGFKLEAPISELGLPDGYRVPGFAFEYFSVKEAPLSSPGVVNHANLILRSSLSPRYGSGPSLVRIRTVTWFVRC